MSNFYPRYFRPFLPYLFFSREEKKGKKYCVLEKKNRKTFIGYSVLELARKSIFYSHLISQEKLYRQNVSRSLCN